jgi:parvulin-like peptidyl-prolyl isomerase
MRRRLLLVLLASLVASAGLALGGAGCGSDEQGGEPDEGDAPDENVERVHGLTPEQAQQTLAKVGDTEITVGELAEELASKGSFIRTRYSSPERRREFLDQMIRFELLAQEAERRGLDELPEVERTRKQMMIRRFLEERFDQGGPEAIPMEDVREYYEAHRSEYHTPEQVRASHILFEDRATAERVLAQLREDPNDLRLFRRLAEEHNTDQATRDRFGDLRFFSRPDQRAEGEPEVPAPVAEAAFEIRQIGQYAPEVVQSDAGYHVVKLTGRRAAMHRSLEEATRPIRNRLWRERREQAIEELIEELRRESDVEENLDMLEHVRIDLPEGDTPVGANPQLPRPPAGAPASGGSR